MLLPFVLLPILVIWGLIGVEIYAKEASIWGVLWAACFAAVLGIPGFGLYFVVPIVLVDIYLLLKMVGNPTA